VSKLALEPAFRSGLSQMVTSRRRLMCMDEPTKKHTLDGSMPEKAVNYYYQMRSNVIHRGKEAIVYHESLVESLDELLPLFRMVLRDEFSAPP